MKTLGEKKVSREDVLAAMRGMSANDADWRGGKTWSLVYHASEEATSLAKDAYAMFFCENGLSPMAFPSLKNFEAEVVSMTAAMLGGGPEAAGTMTSGGTESILMAVKTAREWARAERPGVREPEMLLPISVHPAFEKAAHYFGVKPVHAPLRADYKVDVDAARGLLTDNTILMVGSAPGYPHGVVDPIEELAAIAKQRGILFHTDACLGGFILPWAKRLGYPIPPFDLSVPGVTSISADVHKYGFAAKGASTVIYRDEALRRHQFFAYTEWCGGLYGSPSMTGSRPGGAIAAAWAIMKHFGEEGYLDVSKRILDISDRLKDGIRKIPGLRLVGDPPVSVFSFTSDTLNVLALGDAMESRGWHLDRQQSPDSLHMMVTPVHEKIVEPFLADLAASCKEIAGLSPENVTGMAAMYGMIGAMPDRGAAKEFVIEFLSGLFTPEQ